MSDPIENDVVRRSANPGFALGQLAAAVATSESHPDAATRDRAIAKAGKWMDVLRGMLTGTLSIGSRTPIRDEPAWATPEVTRGGFVTGALRAGGDLLPHESALLARIGDDGAAPPRARLNAYFLTEAGTAELRRMLEDGCYRVDVPEEAALLTAVWLADHGHEDEASALLGEIAPHFGRLRFYPVPAARPLADGPEVHVGTVGEALTAVRAVRPPRALLEQREALRVWAPLEDRIVALFLETVEGPAPLLRTGADGVPLQGEDGRFAVEGGWPCQHYPEGWRERAAALVAEYRALRATHTSNTRPDRPRDAFGRLLRFLTVCAEAPERLTGRDVGLVRLLLAGIGTRRGFPGSERLRELRARQAALTAPPLRAELAAVVADRLAALPQDEGVTSLDAVLAPVTQEEAEAHDVPAGYPLEAFRHRLRLAVSAPVEELVERVIIPSGETLARVVPVLTAQVRAAGLPDPALRRLYGAVYRAFRRRRSLLLLNLESQVKLHELPWVRPMDARRRHAAEGDEAAQRALARVVTLALTAFPQQIIPNKLLKEVRALAAEAELRLPLVDELAADIFMNAFAGTFLQAAQTAGEMLEGTLYARYYAIPYADIRALNDVKPSDYGPPTSAGFLKLCVRRTGLAPAEWRPVAENGTIIEQGLILTTHNLAVLFRALGLDEALRPVLGEMARACFAWVCARMRQPAPGWNARLRMVKNGAYAWRQMVFYLSLLPEEEARAFVDWAGGHLGEQPAALQARLGPALVGLMNAVDGRAPDADGGRVYLGWAADGKHWLLPPNPARAASLADASS